MTITSFNKHIIAFHSISDKIGDTGAQQLAEALKVNTTVKTLDLTVSSWLKLLYHNSLSPSIHSQ